MPANLNEAIQRIKQAGVNHTRILPVTGESALGDNQEIQVKESGEWRTVVTGIKRSMAEDLVRQATNRVILG